MFDKYLRAECAILGGANLVILLPFPYSSSSAEFFATAGVSIANSLGIVDVLAFGSESGDINQLSKIANNMLLPVFEQTLSELKTDNDSKNLGYPALCEIAYKKLFDTEFSSSFFTPNNILAIEYLKALIKTDSKISPYTTKRLGAGYNTEKIVESDFQSASAIRNEFLNSPDSALKYLPKTSELPILNALKAKLIPSSTERLSVAVLSYFRLNSPKASCDIHDADGGLYNRLIAAGAKATSITDLTRLASTKKYTTARIKRAMWNSFFGVTSSDVRTMPHYTQVLGMDTIGQALLKRIKKTTEFPVITKPSSFENLDEIGVRQKKLSDSSDYVFELSRPNPSPADTALKAKPFVKKDEKSR